jgi:hypothetical protein
MPNQPKTKANTFRFTPEELASIDSLRERLAPPGLHPLSRTDVLRIALRRLADTELASSEGQPKKVQKNR